MPKIANPLTGEEAEKILSSYVIDLLMGKGLVSFPLSSIGTPSPVVLVKGTHSSIYVDRDQWQTCVRPILEDESYKILKTPKGRELTRGHGYHRWQDLIGKALRKKFNSNGY